MRYNLTDWGAVPDDDKIIGYGTSTDTALLKIQQDIDKINGATTASNSVPIVIEGGESAFVVSRPFPIYSSSTTLKGAGKFNTSLTTAYGYDFSTVITGVNKRPGGYTFTPDHYFSLDGILDGTQPKGSVGYWTKNDAHLAFWSCPFQDGNNGWGGVSPLTLHICLNGDGSPFPATTYCGLGGALNGPYPFQFICMGSLDGVNRWFSLIFRVSGTTGFYTLNFPACPKNYGGVLRMIICADPTNNTWYVFSDQGNNNPKMMVQIPTYWNYPYPGNTAPPPGSKFIQNITNLPFLIGANSDSIGSRGGVLASWKTCGFWMGNSFRYANQGVGKPLTPITANEPINDNVLFFNGGNANSACMQYLTGSPADTNNGLFDNRFVTTRNGQNLWYGQNTINYGCWMLSDKQGAGVYPVSSTTIQDIAIGTNGAYGDAVSVGDVANLKIQSIFATGGFHGIGSMDFGSSYTHYLDDVDATGLDCGVSLVSAIADISHLRVSRSLRAYMKYRTCSVTVKHAIQEGQFDGDFGICCFSGNGPGGIYTFEDIKTDNESANSPPNKAFIYVEQHGGGSDKTQITLREVSVQNLGKDAAYLWLQEYGTPAQGFPPCYVEMVNSSAVPGGNEAQIVTTGKQFRGRIKGALYNDRVPYLKNLGPDGLGGIVFEHNDYISPPTQSSWCRDGHDFIITHPPDGTYRKFICRTGGTIGQLNNFPQFQGLEYSETTGTELAAWMTSDTYIAVSIPGMQGVGHGSLSAYVKNLLISYLILGKNLPAPPSIAAAFSSARRTEGFYGGVGLMNTPASCWTITAELVTNNTPIVFTASNTIWYTAGPLVALSINDGTHNFIKNNFDQNSSYSPPSGTVITIPPNGITIGTNLGGPIAATTSNGIIDSSTGFLTDYTKLLFNNWAFGGITAPPATKKYLALSTLPSSRLATGANIAEPTWNGYARIPLPPMVPSEMAVQQLSAYYNKVATSFPSVNSNNGQPIYSVYVVDTPQTGTGNALIGMNLIKNRIPSVGQVLTFNTGALIISL